MPLTYVYPSVPEILALIETWAREGRPAVTWDTGNALLIGFRGAEDTATVSLSVIRAHYRVNNYEPYQDSLDRWWADVSETTERGMRAIELFTVGCRVETRRLLSAAAGPAHMGRVMGMDPSSRQVVIRHGDCCPPGVESHVPPDVARQEWRVVVVRRTAWDRILGDD